MADENIGLHDSHSEITMHARCMGFTKINHILRAEVCTGQPRAREAAPKNDIEHQTAAAQRKQTKHLCVASNSGGENRTLQKKASRGFEPRSLDSESRVLTVTPRGLVMIFGHHSVVLRDRRADEWCS